ncbi:hypothetical protein OG349_02325 [Streptomyces sp. NBC_01317]|uniref:hypothetical protein n=1 Tax=Streptomyces sp. NBC_01317 TaxID=2903822 RepID=UPI002E139AB4|nr:hypothetical protein OG349_02325 [Streptomyces sp. NBC_01317]
MSVTVRSRSGHFREYGSWVVALVLAALTALLLGACDSGGHHRLLDAPAGRTSLSVSASDFTSGCADPDPSCAPVVEQHLATQLDQYQPLPALPSAVGGRRPKAKTPLCGGTSRRGPPAGAGRDVLGRVCVSRT